MDKKPRGRPATGNARNNPIQIRLTLDERALIDAAANGTPTSTWIRDKALAAAKRSKH